MKIGIFTDIHVHNYRRFGYDAVSGMSKRLNQQCLVIDQILDHFIHKEKVDLVIDGGDTLHKYGEVPTECVNIVCKMFGEIIHEKIPYILTDGNHDLVALNDPKWFHSINSFFGKKHDEYTLPDGYKIKIVHYGDKVDYDKIKRYNLVILHKTPIGAKVGNYVFTDGVDWRILAENNGLVVFGHIHQPQQLSPNCFVLGAPMHLDFGDVGDRGIYIIDTDTNSLRFIPLEFPRFITVDNYDDFKKDGNYYRIKGLKSKIDDDNVVSVIEPTYFEERIKSDNFEGILKEWLNINGKDDSYLDIIRDLLTSRAATVANFFKGRIVDVHIENFLSFEEAHYSIDNGFTLIKGIIGADGKSNGSGKSTLVGEAIYWCLFGKTTKGLSGDDVVRNRPDQQKDCKVIICIKDDKEYKIIRTRKDGLCIQEHKGNDHLFLTDGLRQPDRQKRLEEILGFDENVFLASCYFSQEGLVTLTGLGDADKTNMITNLLGFDEYDDIYSAVSDKEDVLLQENDEINKEISDLQHQITIADMEIQISIKNEEGLIADVENDLECVDNLQKEIDVLKSSEIVETKEMEKDYDSMIRDMEKAEDGLKFQIENGETDIEVGNYQPQINAINITIGQFNSDLKNVLRNVIELDEEIKNIINANIGAICPKCGSIVSEEHKAAYIAERESKIQGFMVNKKDLEQELVRCQTEVSRLKSEYDFFNKALIENRKKLSELISEKNEVFKMKTRSEARKSTFDLLKQKIAKEIESKNAQITLLEKRVKENEAKITLIRSNIFTLSEKRKEQEKFITVKNDCIIHNKGVEEKLNFWKIAFSPKGIRSVLLDRFCNDFNRIVAEYIANISDSNIQLILTPTKTIKSGEERNKIGLDIVIEGCSAKYQSLSGGEKTRVNTALCLGLNKWVSIKYGVANGLLGIIVMDELFAALDPQGEESVAQQLLEEGKNKALFVISHTAELGTWADREWLVKKESGVSKLYV